MIAGRSRAVAGPILPVPKVGAAPLPSPMPCLHPLPPLLPRTSHSGNSAAKSSPFSCCVWTSGEKSLSSQSPTIARAAARWGKRAGPAGDGDWRTGLEPPSVTEVHKGQKKKRGIKVMLDWLKVSRVSQDLLLWPSSSKALK